MTLVDTSVWIDHAGRAEDLLVDLLQQEEVYSHPYIAGELAMGSFRHRESCCAYIQRFLKLMVEPAELLAFVRRNRLHGRGITDAHLLVAIQLMEDTQLWTLDRRLAEMARHLKLSRIAEYAN